MAKMSPFSTFMEITVMAKRKTSNRRILLTVTDENPSAFLQTLWATHNHQLPLPDEIQILTTAPGYQVLQTNVFDEKEGSFGKLCEQLKIKLPFNQDYIKILTDNDGREIERLDTPRLLSAAADCLVTHVRNLTKDPGTAIDLTLPATSPLAGFASTVMSYFGRDEDEVVLLTAAGDADAPDAKLDVDAFCDSCRGATLDLLPIVYPHYRERVSRALTAGIDRLTLAMLLEKTQPALAKPVLRLDLAAGLIMCREHAVPLETSVFALYLWMVNRRLAGKPDVAAYDEGADEEYLQTYAYVMSKGRTRNVKESPRVQILREKMEAGELDFRAYFLERKSRIKQVLRHHMGAIAASEFTIRGFGRPRHLRYDIPIDNDCIQIIPFPKNVQAPVENFQEEIAESKITRVSRTRAGRIAAEAAAEADKKPKRGPRRRKVKFIEED